MADVARRPNTCGMSATAGGLRVGLIGDHDAGVPAHVGIPVVLRLAGEALKRHLEVQWLATDELGGRDLSVFDGLWCVPASPYRDELAAIRAIRHARESGTPFLGTCGGFQHALVEYARNVLGRADAAHAETDPDAELAVVALLACARVEAAGGVRFEAGSRIARAYGAPRAEETYRCRYGLNPALRAMLEGGPLRFTALDEEDGEARGLELEDHRFFVATLYQPERAGLRGESHPLVEAFVRAMVASRDTLSP